MRRKQHKTSRNNDKSYKRHLDPPMVMDVFSRDLVIWFSKEQESIA